MKIKTWTVHLFSSICFILIGIMNLIEKKYITGIIFISLGIINIFLSMSNYKSSKRTNKMNVPDSLINNMNNELRSLIEEGKEVEAIKKCRIVTGLGLKEAKEYIDLLIEEKNK